MTEFATDEAMTREMIGILRESMEKSHAAG